ncbi:MAG: putative molybdopterin biosynthesis related methylmutase domain / Molybdopterin biosynthesis [Actinomycetia bacterium]|nr:putative molybdopterin biosynthesis related methylmutase domain / Molybdopterin biosynthesis [Actinomycetes bacterium]
MDGPTIVAVDWSGATDMRAQRRHIWAATVRAGGEMKLTSGMSRDEIIDVVVALEPPVVVGFDFSFGVPAWFARDLGCRTIDDVWAAAAANAGTWLHAIAAPFWGRGARLHCDIGAAQQFRACEQRLRDDRLPAKSVFQLVGNGQVGAGSVRGMALLPRLRAAGFAIWPFDDAGTRTVVEIYPRAFRAMAAGARLPAETTTSRDAYDAAISALGMHDQRAHFASLRAAKDAVTRIEGDVWLPATEHHDGGGTR